MANVTGFLRELRRRNVVKVGAAYIIVAWLIIQVADIIFPALNLPDWSITLVTVFILIGFPLILLFAWAFELTPEGVKLTHEVDPTQSITSTTGRKFNLAIIGLLSMALIYVVLQNYVLVEEKPVPGVTAIPATAETPEIKTEQLVEPEIVEDQKSVAVLPFANRSKSEDDAFFVDGIHDDILTQLAKIASLKVISRTSVMRYRDTEKSIKEIGDELGVATLLEGGVQRAGNRVRINMQLIDAETDKHLWAETYNRELTAANIFEIQEQIATEIAGALRATLSPEEQARIATRPTENLDAYNAYLLGKQRLARRTDKSLAEAETYFQEAIELDPDFALAYVGLSDALLLQVAYTGGSREVKEARADAAIHKALALDDNLGEAYTSLGALLDNHLDYENSEAAFNKAITLNPSYATAYHWYGVLLNRIGRHRDAAVQIQKAYELDPLSPIIIYNVATENMRFGRYAESMKLVDKLFAIDSTIPHRLVGKVFLNWFVYGRLDEAAAWTRKQISLYPLSEQGYFNLGQIYAYLEDDQQAKCWLDYSYQLRPEGFFTNLYLVLFHMARGETDSTIPYARQVLKLQPTQLDALVALRNHELQSGDLISARSHYAQAFPALLTEDKPGINGANYHPAIDLAYVLQKSGEAEQAQRLLDSSLEYVRSSGIARLGTDGYALADVLVYALRGEKQQALDTLRQAHDEGWLAGWRYYLEHDPALASIRDEAEFKVIHAELKANMARQFDKVKALEADGDICVRSVVAVNE